MADEFKGVVVGFTGTLSIERFEGADDFAVRSEGHLFVLKDGDAVAVYAPGKWANAKLKD
ncbi:hypothetical protein ACIBBG_33950 [Micromonospora chersina]|uniref:hypothetical protein n=1 Tax=Micromonospora chersina TaxID=47854 RepID=UPI003796978E